MRRSNSHRSPSRDEISPSESHLYISLSLLILPWNKEREKKKKKKLTAAVLNHLETDKQQDWAPFNPGTTNRFFPLHASFSFLIDERMRDTRRRGEGGAQKPAIKEKLLAIQDK